MTCSFQASSLPVLLCHHINERIGKKEVAISVVKYNHKKKVMELCALRVQHARSTPLPDKSLTITHFPLSFLSLSLLHCQEIEANFKLVQQFHHVSKRGIDSFFFKLLLARFGYKILSFFLVMKTIKVI